MYGQRLLAVGGLASLVAACAYALWAFGVDENIEVRVAEQTGLRPRVAEGLGPVFAEDEARRRATDGALEFLFRDDGPAARLAERGYPSPSCDRLAITTVEFSKDARKVSSPGVTSEFPRAVSVWTVRFVAEGLELLEVRLEDGTGKLLGATAHLPPAK